MFGSKNIISIIAIVLCLTSCHKDDSYSPFRASAIHNGVLISYKGDSKAVGIPKTVHAIGAGAFKGNTKVTKVSLTKISARKAILPVAGGVILIFISIFLTFIAGLIPSGMAARKDPVVALRTE